MPIPQLGTKSYKVKRSGTGLGLFATERIKRGTWIIEYVGKVLRGREVTACPSNRYLFETCRTRMIDGSTRKNTARYINHACKPNSQAEIFGGRVFIKAIHPIETGDEITYDYGKEYFDEFLKKPGCLCASCKLKKK